MNMEYFEFSAPGEYPGRIRTFFAKSAPQVLPIIAPIPLPTTQTKPKTRPIPAAQFPLFFPQFSRSLLFWDNAGLCRFLLNISR
jgi:hypothetical protein